MSIWRRAERPARSRFVGERHADVVVVGGGITGTTTAALLARAGRSVVLLEARRVGDGTTGRSTAKVTALQGSRYRTIIDLHGPEAARVYARDQVEALEWISEQVSSLGIDCQWDRRTAVSYSTTASGAGIVHAEASAAREAGLDVEVGRELDLPFPTTASVSLDGQAQFDAVPYIEALAAEVDSYPDCSVHEWSRVVGIGGRGPHRVRTSDGTVHADHVVVATLLPITDRGLFFARAKPSMSYVVALGVPEPLPQGMYLSVDQPTRSLRTAHHDGREVLLVGGEGSGVARGPLPATAVEKLVSWSREHFDVRDVVLSWSAHDLVPADHLPWVGPSSPITPRVLVATGFEKWGMAMGTAAAHRLSRQVLGEGGDEPWGPFGTGRLAARSIPEAAGFNAKVATRLVGDWIRPGSPPGSDGAGRRYRSGLVPKGDPDGRAETDPVSVVCTHLGGICRWNDLERTWDCPLHGSRFEADGTVVAGPAVRPLRGGPDAVEE